MNEANGKSGHPSLIYVDGHPISTHNWRVVVGRQALQGIIAAARTLSDSLSRATGTPVPVMTDAAPMSPESYAFVVGDTVLDTDRVREARSRVADDGFALVMDGHHMHLTAPTGRGTVYAVYRFLETYVGMRYYSERFSVRRDNRDIRMDSDLCAVENPVFMSRDVWWYHLSAHSTDGSVNPQFALTLNDNSGELPEVGGGISYAGGFVHTLPALAEIPNETGVQPCLTDEHVFETVLKNVRRWLKEHPEATIISVSQNDSFPGQKGCSCPRCRAIDEREGTPMGSLLTFVNRIAEAIKDEYPHVYVDTLAYRYTRKAPLHIVPADNVMIRLCSIECCFAHPLDDPGCERNAAFKQDIEAWSRICKHLYIWDYTTNFLYYFTPFPNLKVLLRNIRFFRDHHVIGLFEQGNGQSRSAEFGELRAYLLGKAMWNPGMTDEAYEALMDDFLEGYYGAGWRYIRAYVDITSEIAARGHMGIYDQPTVTLPPDAQPLRGMDPVSGSREMNLCDRLIALWDRALAAERDPVLRAHVERSRMQALYYGWYADREKRAGLLPDLYRLIDYFGIEYFREGSPVKPHEDTDHLPPLD